jgi:DNA-binding PadR family transcriptional regulator
MDPEASMSTLEYHVLLAMAGGPLYGYAIKQAVESESAGTLTPRAGSLYRVIARLMAQGHVRAATPKATSPHPGLARRYYALTAEGRGALAAEANRLRGAAALARKRLGIAGGKS